MKVPQACEHQTATLVFERNGTRLHPNIWMVERCLDCNQELDRRKVSRDYAVYSKRAD
jgi:prophage tail gpP-like protein